MATRRSGPVDGSPAEAAVFVAVLTGGPIARVEIARRAGLSSAAVTRVARPLIDEGYLEVVGGRADSGDDLPRIGRPTLPLQVNALHTGAFGYKVTRERVFGVVCDLAGTTRHAANRELPGTDPKDVIETVADLHRELMRASRRIGFTRMPSQVGLCLSGDIERATGLVRYSPFLDWHDLELGRLLSKRLSARVVIDNDVKALTVAEQWFGAGRGIDNFAVVTIGAGVGCALVVDGALVRGAHSVAGEIGHLPLGNRRLRCHCGGHGCVEAEASTTALIDRARDVTGRADLTNAEAVELARAGDRSLVNVFTRAGQLIGLAIASVANLFGPQRVIVAGEGVAQFDLFEAAVRAAFADQAFGAASDMAIVVRDLPFEEWARGAASVAIEDLVFPSRAKNTETRPAVEDRRG